MTALILASRSAGDAVVAGLPLLLRAVLSAQRAGCHAVTVLDAADPQRVRAILARDRRAAVATVTDTAQLMIDDACLVLIAADCLVTTHLLHTAINAKRPDRPVAIQSTDQSTPAILVVDPAQLTAAIALMRGNHHNLAPQVIDDARAVRVQNDNDIDRAEAALLTELRAATIDTDGPLARIDRIISLQVSRRLVRTPLRPNHITVIGTSLGLLAAAAMARGTYQWGLVGALLFWCAVIVDGCDGEVARMKFLESRFGQLFDVITDNIVHVALFAGLAFGAYHAGRVEHVVLFATALITGFLCASAATYFCLLSDGPVKHLETSSRRGRIRRRVLGVFEALMNRDFAYLILLLALVDRLQWFLWGTVFGTYVYALGLVWVYRLSDPPAATPSSVDLDQIEFPSR